MFRENVVLSQRLYDGLRNPARLARKGFLRRVRGIAGLGRVPFLIVRVFVDQRRFGRPFIYVQA